MNSEHQLKWKWAWPVRTKNLKLKQKWYIHTGAIATSKNEVVFGL